MIGTTAFDDQLLPDDEYGEEADNEMQRRKDELANENNEENTDAQRQC